MAFSKSIEELIQEDTSGLLSKHDSWERVLLSDIAEVLNGYAFPSSYFNSAGKGLPLIRIRDVMSGKTETFYSGPFENEYLVANGDLLIGMDGDFNSSYWCGGKALLNQRVCKISVFSNHYHKKFLGYLLPNYLNAINQNTSSTTVKHLSSATISNILLPLPPENEQVRIVEKLDTLLSDLDQGVAELKTAQEKLTQYRQTLLKSAVEGTLTKEWREVNAHKINETGEQLLVRILKERRARWEKQKLEEFASKDQAPPKNWKDKYPEPIAPDTSGLPELPEGWVWASLDMLGEIVSGVTKGMRRINAVEVFDVPYLRVANVQRGFLDLSEIKTIPATSADIEKYTLVKGDVLFNEGGDRDKLGRGWVWYGEIENCIHQNHVFRLRPFVHELVPELISHYGNTFGQKWFQNAGKQTTNLASINKGILQSFPVPLASYSEQLHIKSLLDTEIDSVDSQIQVVELGLKESDSQRKNILNDAFSGKLVEQNINDEPVSVLLGKIQSDRIAFANQPRLHKPRRKTEIMKSFDANTLKEWVVKNENDSFTFDELEMGFHVEYELLKDALFDLLSDANPLITQHFDKVSGKMFFKRTKK